MINQQLDLSEKFKLIRTRERLTQKEMAEMVGIPYGSYQNYERGTRRAISILEVMKVFHHEKFNKYMAWFMTDKTKIDKQVTPE